MNKISIYCLFYVLCFLPTLAVSQVCSSPQVDADYNITIPCLKYNNQIYDTNLDTLSKESLIWQWNGAINQATCLPDYRHCAQLASNLDLLFPSFDVEGNPLRINLKYLQQPDKYQWQYQASQASTSSTGSLTESALTAIHDNMNKIINTDKTVPGALLGVAQNNEMVMLQAYGVQNQSTQAAVQLDTLFHIGSTHKAITSLLIAKLVDEGVLTWDTKAQSIFSGFQLSDADAASQITIRQMLDMTSGLPKDIPFESSDPARKLLENLNELSLIGSPGAQYKYSNVSVSSAAYLATVAYLKSTNGSVTENDLDNIHAHYEQLLRDKLLTPIGMTDSYLYVNDARNTGRMSSSHHLDNGQFVVSESVDNNVDSIAPAGGLKSTVEDMLKYIMTEMNQGQNINGEQVVSSTNTAERQKLSAGAAAAESYGLCLEQKTINGLSYVGHSGSFDNFNSVIGFFPDKKIAFVLLTNGDSEDILTLTESGLSDFLANQIK